MSLDSLYLQDFVRSAPVCIGHESLESIVDLFSRSRSDRLVLVNAYHHPLGVIRLTSVLPTLTQWVNPGETPLTNIDWAALITPLIVVPQSWSVRQFLQHLPSVEQEYGLVNAEARFVGLLASDRLLTTLVSTSTATFPTDEIATSATGQPVLPPPLPQDVAAQRSQQQQIVSLTQQLLAQRANLEQRLQAQQDEIQYLKHHQGRVAPVDLPSEIAGASESPQPRAEPSGTSEARPTQSPLCLSQVWLELLERLPLPLMIQTDDGRIVAQNAGWRQQVEGIATPIHVWQTAAACLATEPSPPAAAWHLGTEPAAPSTQGTMLGVTDPWMALPDGAEGSRCQLGTQPNSCICICPGQDGSEQVLQFVRVSLGTLLPDFAVDWAIADSPASAAAPRRDRESRIDPQDVEQWVQLATLTAPNATIPLAITAKSPHTATPHTPTEMPAASPASHPPLPALFNTEIAAPHSSQSLWLVIAQDVTQQQQLARELTAKNADLVQLNRLKDEFLACISHELKTPLTAVLGLSSLLKDQTLGELNPRQVHYAELIYQSSRHLMGVVNDILDLTRIETGQLELLHGAVDIPAICHRAFEQAKQLRLLDSKHTHPPENTPILEPSLVLEIDPSLGLLIADEMRLRQMLVHLLSNALKFTESHKPVGLKVSRWGGWIAFTVWDAGIGIPADKQHLIFQKFQQLENPLTRQFEGAGLGLVLTRQLARLHGGDVTFISKEGAGSQFTILLPPTPPDQGWGGRTDAMETPSPSSPTLHYPGGRVPVYSYKVTPEPEQPIFLSPHVRDRLILIVEAVPQFIETLTEQLTSLGYRVVVARSGTEALEKARRLQPSVIFLNPLLPLLSGWDVLTLLKSGAETKHIPVVVTATVMQEGRTREQQANGFLTLPVQPQRLQLTLQQLLADPQQAKPTPPTPTLTILRLFGETTEANPRMPGLDLSEVLRSQHYRILESDDLEQAALLASVWQPNVVILEGIALTYTGQTEEPMAMGDVCPQDYLKNLSQHPVLAALPIITLDAAIAQAANQVPGLKVFPCLLEAPNPAESAIAPDVSMLLQVIQMAAGHRWRSTILAVDLAVLYPPSSQDNPAAQPLNANPTTPQSHRQPSPRITHFPQESEWLQALTQYLQTAGFEALIGQSWQEVIQQITSHSVDVLVLCWTEGDPEPTALSHLSQLRDQHGDFPIIVLDHRDPELVATHHHPLPELVQQLATTILSPPIAMAELLNTIQQMLR